ncbi:proline-rich protein PRCC [Lingula anatina]|uniref:Proline-rich protein PRCC n=1 Tax=Lingula anatina TaxID=7574 RepID=A0A1S3HJU3_LINAN|nr:proline-rich protein PRCC [Lingula anatina]|eukprot:XP_013386388.1 proline-rich protein PRCC [Lingula anatina]
MSLVSYGNSDSEESDNEEIIEAKDEALKQDNKALQSRLEPSFLASSNNNGSVPTTSLLAGLPPPKSSRQQAPTEYTEEDEVLPNSSMNLPAPVLHKGGLNLQQPKKAKERQKVKIAIPNLTSVDSDEEDEPAPKKIKPAAGKCGLFAVLPAPKNAVTKQTTRPLVPHTLTQKPAPKPPVPKLPVSVKQTSGVASRNKLVDVDSDEDEEGNDVTGGSSFFSFADKEKDTIETNSTVPPVSVPKERTTSSVLKQKLPDAVAKALSSTGTTLNTNNETSTTEEPLSGPRFDYKTEMAYGGGYTGTETASGGYITPGTSDEHGAKGIDYGSNEAYYDSQGVDYNNSTAYYGGYEQGGASYYQQEEVNQLMQDQEFLKIQGKKKRGKEEIQIIDANADDVLDPMEYTKTLSAEVPYQSHKKKDGSMPTSQQRKKHQITYLAFQAKERELELKNEWSQNRMTKKQTQSKYGF